MVYHYRRLLACSTLRLGYSHQLISKRQSLLIYYQTPIYALFRKVRITSPLSTYFPPKEANRVSIIERENIWTIPNVLCLSRIAVTPYLGYLIINADFLPAFYLMVFAGFTDLLDGFIARTWYGQSSKFGSFLDPLADKILITTTFITMTYSNLIPVPLTSLIIARDVCLVIAAFYIRYLSLPSPKTFARYFNATHVTAQLAPTTISKYNTMVQLVTVAAILTGSAFNFHDHPIIPCLWYLTAATTVASSISYIISKDTYKILIKSKFGQKDS